MNKILVIGSSNIDLIIKTERLPKPGETVGGGEFAQANGGKGANQAVAAAKAGGKVTFISCVGDDDFGSKQLEGFIKIGINVEGVTIEREITTGVALILVDQFGENSIAISPGANQRLDVQKIDHFHSLLEKTEYILLQHEIPMETIKYVIKKGKELDKKIMLNPAPAAEITQELYPMIDTLILNESEAEYLTQQPVESNDEIEKVASSFLQRGVNHVILTLGSQGGFFCSKGERFSFPAFKVEVVDTTAAGDVFCGAYAVAVSEGKNFKDATRFAAAASALAVTKMGAQPSAPGREELDFFLKKRV